MKKRIFTVLLCLLYFLYPCIPKHTVSAQTSLDNAAVGGYACILTDTAYFYASKDNRRGLFLLPKTYFVKILTLDVEFCKIEYLYDSEYTQKLTGYAKTDDLTFVNYTPNNPYLFHLFDVRYTIDGAFSDDDSFLDQITVTCAYYGDYRIGSETYCYVRRGDTFGYIPKPTAFVYEENPEYADRLIQTPPDGTEDNTPTEKMSAAQIAILVTLCLLVPVLAALILKPSKHTLYEPEQE